MARNSRTATVTKSLLSIKLPELARALSRIGSHEFSSSWHLQNLHIGNSRLLGGSACFEDLKGSLRAKSVAIGWMWSIPEQPTRLVTDDLSFIIPPVLNELRCTPIPSSLVALPVVLENSAQRHLAWFTPTQSPPVGHHTHYDQFFSREFTDFPLPKHSHHSTQTAFSMMDHNSATTSINMWESRAAVVTAL
jgi:hypothetical protein